MDEAAMSLGAVTGYVVRAGTWRHLSNHAETAAAFRRALVRDPANGRCTSTLADIAAGNGDFVEAAALAARGEELEPDDLSAEVAPR